MSQNQAPHPMHDDEGYGGDSEAGESGSLMGGSLAEGRNVAARRRDPVPIGFADDDEPTFSP